MAADSDEEDFEDAVAGNSRENSDNDNNSSDSDSDSDSDDDSGRKRPGFSFDLDEALLADDSHTVQAAIKRRKIQDARQKGQGFGSGQSSASQAMPGSTAGFVKTEPGTTTTAVKTEPGAVIVKRELSIKAEPQQRGNDKGKGPASVYDLTADSDSDDDLLCLDDVLGAKVVYKEDVKLARKLQEEEDRKLAEKLSSENDDPEMQALPAVKPSGFANSSIGAALDAVRRMGKPFLRAVSVKPDPGLRIKPEPADANGVYRILKDLHTPDEPSQPNPFGAGPSGSQRANSLPPQQPGPSNFDEPQVQDEKEAISSFFKAVEQNIQIQVTPKDNRIKTPWQFAENVRLLEHQKLGVDWMHKQEKGKNRGGILADDMVGFEGEGAAPEQQANRPFSQTPHGMGKTIQTIALMLINPAEAASQRKTTLVICPTSLLYQWERELLTRTRGGTFKVFIHYGNKKAKKATDFSKFDVVLTTYGTLAAEWPDLRDETKHKKNEPVLSEWDKENADEEYQRDQEGIEDKAEIIRAQAGPLLSFAWYRVVLDEAQTIKNKRTKGANACRWLNGTYRWCLTGTPFQNSVEELYSLLLFLQVEPWCKWAHFKKDVVDQIRRGRQGSAVRKVQIMLQGICLRRTKTSMLDGKPILESLPPKTIHEQVVQFSPDEREFYSALEGRVRLQFNKYVKQGTVLKNYSNILALLSKLRQACCHPTLVKTEKLIAGVNDGDDDENGGGPADEANARKLSAAIVARIKGEGLTEQECAICTDKIEYADGVLLSRCGHPYCRLCIEAYMENGAANGCPICRADVDADPDKLVTFSAFRRVHLPQAAAEKMKPEGNEDEEDEDEEEEEVREWKSSAKIDRCLEILDDIRNKNPGEKTIVFTQWRGMHGLLGVPLAQRGVKFVRIDGSINVKKRAEAVEIFSRDPDVNVMILSLRCGSLGLNLVAASSIILTDVWWNPAVENQAMDRAHRFGQTKPVKVHKITVADSVEDRILELQSQKEKIFNAAFDGGSLKKMQAARLNVDDLVRLFGADEDEMDY